MRSAWAASQKEKGGRREPVRPTLPAKPTAPLASWAGSAGSCPAGAPPSPGR
ncbi:hypothetical protein HMPREF0262_02749 [Clostridium sp. ATCC 29733]|nr:hypothetical protein HMPREF0262_02749 [Clostridium sp. ATCC 29733]